MNTNEVPRRNRLDLNTPVELKIREAIDAVEALGAHERLTEAVTVLQHARECVADWVDQGSPGATKYGESVK